MFIFGNELLFGRTLYNSMVFIGTASPCDFSLKDFFSQICLKIPFICSSFAILFLCSFQRLLLETVFFFVYFYYYGGSLKEYQKIRQKLYRKGRKTCGFRFALYLRWRFNNMDRFRNHFTVSHWAWGRFFWF